MRPRFPSPSPAPSVWPCRRPVLAAAALWCGLLAASAARSRAPDRRSTADAAASTVAARRELASLLDAASELDDPGQLIAVNAFFNRRIVFRDDLDAWGETDHWATPLEALARGEGDCEDFAIAKYFTLTALGVPTDRLRLVYMRAWMPGPPPRLQPHMVLAHFDAPSADPSILDNLVADVQPASRRADLAPVYSFNAYGLWLGLGPQAAGDPLQRLPRWRQLLRRAQAEGFR